MSNQVKRDIPVISYEGSGYQTDFWIGQGRDYEDTIERLVLNQLMPKVGKRVVEIGAGFGRLANLYQGYDQIILFDYSRTLLQQAVKEWGHDPRFLFVAGNIYELPFADGTLDTLVMVRVMHHLADVEAALSQIKRVLHAESVAILEYANKRNLKSLMRWFLGQQSWSPNDLEPVEFVELNFDFHPAWMNKRFEQVGLHKEQQLAVSHFRLPLLKELFKANQLAQFERILLKPGGFFPLAPSVFVKARAQTGQVAQSGNEEITDVTRLFRCPKCETESLSHESDLGLRCTNCGARYMRENNIWDFKNPK